MRMLLLVVALAGCSSTRNPETCLQGLCPDPAFPFCDTDGSLSGEPNSCIAVDCPPDAFKECRGDHALTCNATGDNYDLVECEFGCSASGCIPCNSPECEKRIVPRYTPGLCNVLAAPSELTISSDTMIDTSDASNCDLTVGQLTGPELCVLRHTKITLERNRTLTATGSRALAIVADRDVVIDGVLDVSGGVNRSGAGGGLFISGVPTDPSIPGGGAGYRHAGGAAGNMTTQGGANNGGAARPDPLLSTEFFGGARSTQNGTNGGGAVSVVSCRGTVHVPGVISAGGGGGYGGNRVGTTYYPPVGGGAGGTIGLQGMNVKVTGELWANGGGGGGGGLNLSGVGFPGRDALQSTASAPGGGGIAGGAGGTTAPPGPGNSGSTPGAGGGSAGYIIVYIPEFVVPTLTPLGVSPKLEATQVIPTN